ncbi:NAD(+) diphosphatase [Altericroceibacterium endophyticum]|uniref:NAD(+) diphosphatase n=1 Tax=Altericroceibacterium endophyticum TaxID=1808508 RepID=A0A6I4T6P0_9SPHN|nr:NAD(+) diphosphatase [Altericroceibacterium endophyticum]MXO66874.1 NAD(+) diphosphatase [Altericroceibacterium endophyticum]
MSALISPAFAGHPLDRADNTRADPEQLAALRQPDALLLALDGLVPRLDENGRLEWRKLSAAPEDAELVFLGLLDGQAAFVMVPQEGDQNPAFAHKQTWQAVALLNSAELALYGGARSIADWHARHRFCARCGSPTQIAKGGWQRGCVNEKCGAQHFPRVDPVAIMLVEHQGRLLLGRGLNFPPGRYSALAGFIEPGETIEEGAAREVLEEVGVVLEDVRYIGSQPWPFPSQLMVGCHGFAAGDQLTIDTTELEDARWFTRAEVEQALIDKDKSPHFIPPPPQAIAHDLLQWWVKNGAGAV